eukprot:scaffold56905_cov31-Prasinocladus_malaysianus.AAC.2
METKVTQDSQIQRKDELKEERDHNAAMRAIVAGVWPDDKNVRANLLSRNLGLKVVSIRCNR